MTRPHENDCFRAYRTVEGKENCFASWSVLELDGGSLPEAEWIRDWGSAK